MRILVVTQALDQEDDNQGAFHAWWKELSQRLERLIIIGLRVGTYDLPPNVTVYSLGKDHGEPKWRQALRFYQILWRTRGQYDFLLAHQCPEYLLGATLIVPRTPKILWYAFGGTSWRLWLAEKLATRIFTSTPEGFRLSSKKLVVIGQGIDTDRFRFVSRRSLRPSLRLLFLGRISPLKDLVTLLRAVEQLPHTSLTIAGRALTPESQRYEQQIRRQADKLGRRVVFVGRVPYTKVPQLLAAHDILVNPSKTGSLDKTVLEAMAAGVVPVTCNEAVAGLLPRELRPLLVFPPGNAVALAGRIRKIGRLPRKDIQVIHYTLRQLIKTSHNVDTLIANMLLELREIV